MRTNPDCPACGGEGFVEVDVPGYRYEHTTKMVECPLCATPRGHEESMLADLGSPEGAEDEEYEEWLASVFFFDEVPTLW